MLTKRLRELRNDKGKKQHEVADYLGITRPAYTAYESGNRQPDLTTVAKLADFFDCSTDYLLGKTNIRKYPHTIAAHHDGDDYTEEELADIEKFKEFVRSKREQEKEK